MSASCAILGLSQSPPELPMRLLWTIIILMAVVLGAAVIIVLAGRWSKRMLSDNPGPASDLTSFRVLYERGKISQEDYDKIRHRLARNLHEDRGAAASRQPAASGERMAANPSPPPGTTDPPPENQQSGDTSIQAS
jgi:hypothetical protein